MSVFFNWILIDNAIFTPKKVSYIDVNVIIINYYKFETDYSLTIKLEV